MKKIIKTVWKFIMKYVLKFYTNNYNLYVDNYPKNLENKNFYSQFGQDKYIFEQIFKNKKDGFFVDIGANYPISCNNTYLFELNNWKGLAIEPQGYLREMWPKERKAECLPYVIGEENKIIDFQNGKNDEHGLSGVLGFNKVKSTESIIKIEQKTLESILNQKNIKDIDFISIDVEGYEMNVLKGINFDKNNIKVICVENDINLNFMKIPFIGKKISSELGNNIIRKYLKNKGYNHIARIVCDDIFIKN